MLPTSIQYFYTVRQGDTLYAIAKRFELPIESLIASNNLLPPYTIFIGQQLSIPLGVHHYRVRKGDTVYNISQFFGIPMSSIIEVNQLNPPYTINPDQLLTIPPGVPYYVVQPGDTLFQIARRFNVVTRGSSNYELLRQVNQLSSYTLYPGMRLIIPYAPIGEFGLLAYISDRGGTFDLWLYDISNGQNMRLTTGLADRLSVPFWSPNSSRIAFVGKDSVIYVITISTGEITSIDQLEEGGIHTLDWSPDAQDIAYTKGNQIILYNVVTHTARRIDQIGVTDVQWFPSGNEILFQALDENGVSQLFRMRVDTLFKQKVTMNENGPLHSIRLSPNGRYALYTSPGVSISIIYIIDLATLQVFEVGGGPLAKNYYPEWSPDSSSIAYSATAFAELGYYSLVRTVSNRSTNDRTWAVSTCFATPVTWSPDSRKLVYLSGCTEDQYAKDMWYIDQAHPVPIRLLGGVNISSVKWSKTPRRRTFRNLEYKVQFQYPMNWVRQTNERYEGTDGFFQIGAIAGGSNIEEICHNEAFHSLLPYGSQPQIVSTTVQNQEACYIFPSVDQPLDMKDQAALIIRYPIPVVIQGEIYQYFILWASQEHIREIGQSLTFLNNGGKPHHF